jgi:predicted dehydrogenase
VRAPRVGILGARRVRQGLGPFVARDLVAAGAEVPCFLVTSEAAVDAARRAIREAAGVEARGYTRLDAMLAEESLDALAILTPSETHAHYLAAVAEAGLHALCEKPLCWGAPALVAGASRCVRGFAERGLLLYENCQWPFTLPAFEALHPGSLAAPPRRFRMQMEPSSRGLQSVGDALPHPISLLQALLPGAPRVRDVAFSTRDPQAPQLTVRFRYESDAGACDAEVMLTHSESWPRRTSYSIEGRSAARRVSPEDYRLCFADAERSVPLPDPLTRLVADFVDALRSGRKTEQGPILQRMQVLVEIAAAYAPEEIR